MGDASEILVTGSSSGLGKYCVEHFNGVGFTRHSSLAELKQRTGQPFRAIIHCAFNPKADVSSAALYDYLNDTLLLTRELIQIPHDKFIFISSADVYPKTEIQHTEDEEINLNDVNNIYGLSKLMTEAVVQNEAADHLILRTTALLGKDARKNSLMKILMDDQVKLTLAGSSSFNYISHEDVGSFITHALLKDLTGIYNLGADTSVTLEDICKHYQRHVTFGEYHYMSAAVSNKKASAIMQNFNKSSLDTINQFMKIFSL
jgi:nucleoside-diphosphate-sugar epimerase